LHLALGVCHSTFRTLCPKRIFHYAYTPFNGSHTVCACQVAATTAGAIASCSAYSCKATLGHVVDAITEVTANFGDLSAELSA
jgi:hypothetical protein